MGPHPLHELEQVILPPFTMRGLIELFSLKVPSWKWVGWGEGQSEETGIQQQPKPGYSAT
jgi:hypothetical protein